MKTLIFLSILFWTIALPALGEFTDADLDKIRLIINESEMQRYSKRNSKQRSPQSKKNSKQRLPQSSRNSKKILPAPGKT